MKYVRLAADKIKENLRTNIIGREVITLDRAVSTMDIAKEMLKEEQVQEANNEEQIQRDGSHSTWMMDLISLSIIPASSHRTAW